MSVKKNKKLRRAISPEEQVAKILKKLAEMRPHFVNVHSPNGDYRRISLGNEGSVAVEFWEPKARAPRAYVYGGGEALGRDGNE